MSDHDNEEENDDSYGENVLEAAGISVVTPKRGPLEIRVDNVTLGRGDALADAILDAFAGPDVADSLAALAKLPMSDDAKKALGAIRSDVKRATARQAVAHEHAFDLCLALVCAEDIDEVDEVVGRLLDEGDDGEEDTDDAPSDSGVRIRRDG